MRRNLGSSSRGKRPLRSALAVALLGLLGPIPSPAGPGDLLLSPTRVVFEGRQRTVEITLVNTSTAPATYRISLVRLRMNEEGGTRRIEEKDVQPGERFADELVRYSPHQVTLEPGAAQSIRMMLRKPDVLAAGEYRSHLLVHALPTGEQDETNGDGAKALSVQITAIYGITIPVIVRHGETSVQARLSDLAVAAGAKPDAPPTLRFRIHREGNRSVYGNLSATFTPRGGKPLIVGAANGLAVYTPNATRSGGLELHPPPGTVLRQGSLRLTYREAGEAGKGTPVAEAEILLP